MSCLTRRSASLARSGSSASSDSSGAPLPLLLVSVIGLSVLALDQLTKWIVHTSLPLGGPSQPFLGEYVRWTYIHNAGAAFGLLEGNRWFFVAVSLISALVILYLAARGGHRRLASLVALGLILGGAVGNLVDRLWLGVVIDFVDVGIGANRFWIFNVADSGISVGVGLLALLMLLEGRADARDPESSRSEPGLSETGAPARSERETTP